MAPFRVGVVAALLCGAGLLAFHEFSADGITYAANGRGRDASSSRVTTLQFTSAPRSATPRTGTEAGSPRAAIAFALERAGAVDLDIFDLEGRAIATVARREYREAGLHRISWRPDPDQPLEPGLYFVRLRTDTGIWRQTIIRVPDTRSRSGRS